MRRGVALRHQSSTHWNPVSGSRWLGPRSLQRGWARPSARCRRRIRVSAGSKLPPLLPRSSSMAPPVRESRRTRHLCRGRSHLAVLAHASAVERLRSRAGLLDLRSRPQRRRSRLVRRGRADLASLVVRDRQRHAAPHARSRPVPAGSSATRLTCASGNSPAIPLVDALDSGHARPQSAQSCGLVRRAGPSGPRSSRRVAEVSTGAAVGSRPHRCGVSAVAAGFAAV